MTIKTFTPIQLWKDFDDSLYNESINITEYKNLDDYTAIKLYFNAINRSDGPVRVFVKLYLPTGGKNLPTVLLIPDIVNYNADSELIKMALLGYCTATFDYSGCGLDGHTNYPESLFYGNAKEAHDHIDTANHGANKTSPYLWSKIARKVITLLCSLPYVDESKIALTSVNFGVNMLMQVASMDKRIKCAVSIFNNGSSM